MIKGLALYIVIALSLIHVTLNSNSNELTAHMATYESIIIKRDMGEEFLLNQFKTNQMIKREFITALELHKENSKKEIQQYNDIKASLEFKQSFNGRSSFKYWIFVFGLSLSFFVLALKYVYFNLKMNLSQTHQKAIFFESAAWLTVSFFWLLHAVVTKTEDFNSIYYLLVGLLISGLMAISIVLSMNYEINKKSNTARAIILLIALVSDIKINHYSKMAAMALDKFNKDIIDKDADKVNNKIVKTLENLGVPKNNFDT